MLIRDFLLLQCVIQLFEEFVLMTRREKLFRMVWYLRGMMGRMSESGRAYMRRMQTGKKRDGLWRDESSVPKIHNN